GAPIRFWIIGGLTAGSALMTLLSQNIVRSATWLLFALGGTSGIFFLLGADFVGATQLLIYVGGTLILVVFGVMLTAQGPFITMKTSAVEWAMSGVVGLVLLSVLAVTVMTVRQSARYGDTQNELEPPYGTLKTYRQKQRLSQDPATSPYSSVIGQGFLGVGVGPAHGEGKNRVRTHYLLPFEIVSVHLLVVLIGAA